MTRAESLRVLEQEIGVLVRRIRRVVAERAAAVDPSLQPASYLMLGYVAQEGPLRASEMCTVFTIDKGAISRQVQHLVDLGLIQRTPDPEDGRAALISVTDEAVTRMEHVSTARRAWLDSALGDWDDNDLTQFTHLLGRYNGALSPSE